MGRLSTLIEGFKKMTTGHVIGYLFVAIVCSVFWAIVAAGLAVEFACQW